MSEWEELDLQNKIMDILKNVTPKDPEHHLNPPFLSSYQIAIKFKETYPDEFLDDEFIAMKMPLGGKFTGQNTSFAQYIARQLSQIIKKNQETQTPSELEGAFLCCDDLRNLSYNNPGKPVKSSLGTTGDMAIFRYKPLV